MRRRGMIHKKTINGRKTGRRDPLSQTGTALFLVLCLAVSFGFLGVKYVIAPWMNGSLEREAEAQSGGNAQENDPGEVEPQQNADDQTQGGAQAQPEVPDQPEEQNDAIPKVETQVETLESQGFAVQFGSFSTEEAANVRVGELAAQNIAATVQQRDGSWKVISSGFGTKEEARAAAAGWKALVGDLFVVAI